MTRVSRTPTNPHDQLRKLNDALRRLQAKITAVQTQAAALLVSSPSVVAGGVVDVGRENAEGSAVTAARSDHVHDVVMVHAASFGFAVGAAGAWYVPWGPWQNEASGGAESVANCWHVPFTGTITGVRLHTSADAGNVTLTIRDNDLNQLAQEVETVAGITIGAASDFGADFTFDLDVTAGDLIVMGASFAANPGNVLGWLYLEVA